MTDLYSARPNELKEICLASFAVNYNVLLSVNDCNLNDVTERSSDHSTQNSIEKFSNKIQLHKG